MRKQILVLMALSLVAVSGSALAEAPKEKGPEVIRFKMKDLELPFSHWKHQKALNEECYHCHSTTLGKIDNWGKETARKLCISCHELEDKGPVYCRQCHTKKKKKK
jgi:predicted CXXCH cytochrome family protein